MMILRFDLESAYALRGEGESDDAWSRWIDEAVAAVTAIRRVLDRHDAPATFFVVGRVLEKAGARLADVLKDGDRIDIQSHTYTHMHIRSHEEAVAHQFRDELAKTAALIEQYFGKRPIGLCAPGNFYRGLRGFKEPLQVLWEEGYRFVGSDGAGPPERPMPALMTQPYWYAEEGFPDLLEQPLTGWHCNMLFNTGGQSNGFTPQVGFPDSAMLETLPTTVEQGFSARARELQYAIDHDLIYAPCNHPWSVYRFDPELTHLDRLIAMAETHQVPIRNCLQLYETLANSHLKCNRTDKKQDISVGGP